MKEFQSRVLELASRIPKGKVTSYREIARAMGKPRAYRAVANALATNPYQIRIPCHRVIRSNGKVGGYGGSIQDSANKARILASEGVKIKDQKVDLSKFLFKLRS